MDISVSSYKKLLNTWWILKLAYGLVFILAGLDKLFDTNLIVQWTQYLSHFVQQIIPMDAVTIMRGVGLIEVIAGFIILSGFTRLGAWFVGVWLLLISINLVSMGTYYDIAIRDVLLALGSFTLAWLTDIKNEVEL